MVTCSFCGTVPPGAVTDSAPDAGSDVAPLTWTSAVERGKILWFCDACSREHLRATESKLDSEWW